MDSDKKIRLLDNQIKLLESFPEQGMGYQIVDIELQNGGKLFERIVFNSTYLKLNADESIDASSIETIKLHDKKNYR
jgi:hypothetical protein